MGLAWIQDSSAPHGEWGAGTLRGGRYLLSYLQLEVLLYRVEEAALAARVEHALLNAALVARHGVDEHCWGGRGEPTQAVAPADLYTHSRPKQWLAIDAPGQLMIEVPVTATYLQIQGGHPHGYAYTGRSGSGQHLGVPVRVAGPRLWVLCVPARWSPVPGPVSEQEQRRRESITVPIRKQDWWEGRGVGGPSGCRG